MIFIDATQVSDNLYLEGVYNASSSIITQDYSIDGESVITGISLRGGEKFSITSQSDGGKQQGFWCQHQLDEINILKAAASPITVDYHGTAINAYIVSVNVRPKDINAPEGPNKKFTGKVNFVRT